MMARSSEVIFMAEYIKNVLYFAAVRQDKELKSTQKTHYFSIDNDLVYENYYSDFGPLNLGCVYKYCKLLSEKLKIYLNKQTIVHYTSIDPKKKANAAFLLGCYGVLYLSLSPKDAMKPLIARGTNYRPFQDATQGDSSEHTITIMDCLKAIKKASELGFFNFKDFNYEEYERLDKITGGDLNWIVPGKFLAFIGPVDYSVSLYHPPEMYIDYFLENNVKIVIRLNKRLYDGNVFANAGIMHYDLFFADGSCPPRHILFKFLQISEDSMGALAVHCKAGLGRTGSLIGSYLIKHYRMSAREAIAWMRICRPGSVIGQQQSWLEQVEPWLIKQGYLYRKKNFQDGDKLPTHEYGVYSIAEKANKRRPVLFQKSPSPPPPMQRYVRSDISPPPRPQASRIREDKSGAEDEEVFLHSCDLTAKPETEKNTSLAQMRGCVIKNNTRSEQNDHNRYGEDRRNVSLWKKCLCCKPCRKKCKDDVWILAVRCVKITPKKCRNTCCCSFLDMVAAIKVEKEHYGRVKTDSNLTIPHRGDNAERPNSSPRRSGAGEPRPTRPSSHVSSKMQARITNKPSQNDSSVRNLGGFYPGSQIRSPAGPLLKTVNDAKNYLLKSSTNTDDRLKNLKSAITVTPHYSYRISNYTGDRKTPGNMAHNTPSSFSAAHGSTQPVQRRRLGRSPSPPQTRIMDQTRATNTPTPSEKALGRDASKIALKEALSRLKVIAARNGSIGAGSVGAASLGARRDAPAPMRAPSVRSDERPLATQGDMLNSIKFQRRFRDTFDGEKLNKAFNDKFSVSKDKEVKKRDCNIKNIPSITSTATKPGVYHQHYMAPREKPSQPRGMVSPTRPASPKGRRILQHTFQ